MEAKQFGQFIAGIRKEKKMTQAELAQQIHVTDKAVSRWERGAWVSGYPNAGTAGTSSWNYGSGTDALRKKRNRGAGSTTGRTQIYPGRGG